MAVIIKSSGEITHVEPINGCDYQRLEICKLIGCEMIQIVRLNTKREILVVDEEGIGNGKMINRMASDLFKQEIVGDVLMCNDEEIL